MRLNNIAGQKFGRLLVLNRVENVNGRVAYLCKCDCGKEVIVKSGDLTSGNTKSCGCLRTEKLLQRSISHGKSKTRLYKIWKGIRNRCYNQKHHDYIHYGERGITVCDEWKNDFIAFEKWAKNNGYNEKLTIERIDANSNYCPDNCKWITIQEQQSNKRNSHYIEYQGEKRTLAEWSRILDINHAVILTRLRRGWPVEKALSPIKFRTNGKPR